MRVWIAIWMLAISLIVVGLEGSVLVRKFTRFVTEIFSSLVSILFIFESLAKLATVRPSSGALGRWRSCSLLCQSRRGGGSMAGVARPVSRCPGRGRGRAGVAAR